MSRLDRSRVLEFNSRLARGLDLPGVGRVLGTRMAWDAAQFAAWAELRLTPGTTLERILREAVPRQLGLDERARAAATAEALARAARIRGEVPLE
jgi:hypothetical protein